MEARGWIRRPTSFPAMSTTTKPNKSSVNQDVQGSVSAGDLAFRTCRDQRNQLKCCIAVRRPYGQIVVKGRKTDNLKSRLLRTQEPRAYSKIASCVSLIEVELTDGKHPRTEAPSPSRHRFGPSPKESGVPAAWLRSWSLCGNSRYRGQRTVPRVV